MQQKKKTKQNNKRRSLYAESKDKTAQQKKTKQRNKRRQNCLFAEGLEELKVFFVCKPRSKGLAWIGYPCLQQPNTVSIKKTEDSFYLDCSKEFF